MNFILTVLAISIVIFVSILIIMAIVTSILYVYIAYRFIKVFIDQPENVKKHTIDSFKVGDKVGDKI